MEQTSSHKLITDYYSQLRAGHETADIVWSVISAIVADEEMNLIQKTFQLGALLHSNTKNPSFEYVANIIAEVLRMDNLLDNQEIRTAKEWRSIVTVAGSWKKWQKTINISTPAAFVAWSFWAQILKPCSRATSSLTWSSDYFSLLWGKFQDLRTTNNIFEKTNIWLFSIEWLIPKFDALYGWNALVPTVLSYWLPGMVTPVKTESLFYWLSMPDIEVSIRSLHLLWYKNVLVGNTSDDKVNFVDELWLHAHNNSVYWKTVWHATQLQIADPVGLLWVERQSIKLIAQKWDMFQNIAASVQVLQGKWEKPHQKIIWLNAWAMLMLTWHAENLREWYERALEEILTWRPFQKLEEVVIESGWKLLYE